MNKKFLKYARGFTKIYKKQFGKNPTMGILISNGWLDAKDEIGVNLYARGKEDCKKFLVKML